MPLGFSQNRCFQLCFHAIEIQPFQGILRIGMQTGLHFSVCNQSDAVALPAKMGAHRADKANIAQCARQVEEFGNTAIFGSRFRQSLQNPCKWNIRFRAKAGAVAHGHHFNKTHIHRILPGKLRQRKDLIIVKSANEHGIEFDLLKVSIQGRMKPLPEVIQTASAGNVGILLRIQGIQAQV